MFALTLSLSLSLNYTLLNAMYRDPLNTPILGN